jgi:NAD(P)-dependent dehydrogenase (short-subunit alcohol dehydrogenase family)
MSTTSQTALISGAGSGIGFGIASALADLGLRIGLLGRSRDKLETAASKLPPCSLGPHWFDECDVSDRSSAEKSVARAVEILGPIDVLVCNAGLNVPKRGLAVLDPADWDMQIAVNLTGAYNLVHFVLPEMRKRKCGLIVQICSISGLRASPLGGAAYSASKFGQAALGICIGREERENGIRSSVVYPGEVETPILDKRPVAVAPERRQQILQPEDVGAAVRFLVELHPRASIPELVIKPAVDDWA